MRTTARANRDRFEDEPRLALQLSHQHDLAGGDLRYFKNVARHWYSRCDVGLVAQKLKDHRDSLVAVGQGDEIALTTVIDIAAEHLDNPSTAGDLRIHPLSATGNAIC